MAIVVLPAGTGVDPGQPCVPVGAETARRPSQFDVQVPAEEKILGATDLIAVFRRGVPVLTLLDRQPRVAQPAIARQPVGRQRRVRVTGKARFLAADTGVQALHPTAPVARRPAVVGLRGMQGCGELVDDAAAVVARIDLGHALGADAGGPGGVERVERPLEVGAAGPAIAVVRDGDAAAQVRRADALGTELREGRCPVHVARPAKQQPGSGAEQVFLLQAEPGTVDAAGAPERNAGRQRPDIAHGDPDVDRIGLRIVGDRRHRGAVEVNTRAQQAFAFAQQAVQVLIAAGEEQLAADGRLPGADVQRVRRPVQPVVLARVARVEDIPDHHLDPADARVP